VVFASIIIDLSAEFMMRSAAAPRRESAEAA
jgi:hypothetical protein